MRVIVILLFSFSMVNAQSYKVMTYNIRYDNPQDGVNRWDSRKEKVFALLKKYDPDILGVQEALRHQLKDITDNQPQYVSVGVGRDDGKEKGEYSAVLYRKDKLDVVDQKTYWLSETPDVPGSKNWDAAITRIVTWIRFRDKSSGKTFQVFNTHFDHIGKEARKNSASLIHQWISEQRKKFGEEVIVTGDLNIERTEEPYSIMIRSSANLLKDSQPASETAGTFCTFEVAGPPCRGIDYIFTSGKWISSGYQIIKDNDGKYYPSDHLPVIVTLKLN